jgi:transposase
MTRHRRFTLEFKRLVVLDFLEKRQGLRKLARKHNLTRNLLSQWIRKYETGQLTDQIPDAHRIAEYEGKIAELERKVGQLTMEIDLLKKGDQLARRPSGDNYSIVSGPQVSPSRGDVES